MTTNVLNYFEQAPSGNGAPTDNILHLEGTVVGKSGSQFPFVADATDLPTAIALVNALKAGAIDTGFMAPS